MLDALEALNNVLFNTGNDHPGYDRLVAVISEVYQLQKLFPEVDGDCWIPGNPAAGLR